ncbi:MAG: response regulator transcription factor [Candidatus Limnocylindrales bacterium]
MAGRRHARQARLAGALIRVAIIDDHPVVSEGTAAVLRSTDDLQVVGVAGSLAAAHEAGLVDAAAVDVVLLDVRLGTGSGLDLLAGTDRPPMPAIIVLTAFDYPQYAEAALRLGAAGFVVKTAPLAELLDAIRRVAGGGMAFAVRPSPSARIHLTDRERDVVRLIVEGRSNDEIGTALGIGAKTVETHLARLFLRFGIASRTELATRALREGWLEVPAGG